MFSAVGKGWTIDNIRLNMGGMHNVENCLLAISIAKQLDIADEKIIAAVDAFLGVKRRFEYIVKTSSHIYIDDYAHHPEELRALINGVKDLYPEKKTTLVFQPHLYSRTRDLADEFSQVLDMADEVWLMPIYPARELPIEGVDSDMLARRMKKYAMLLNQEQLLSKINEEKPELIISAGAGDIDKMIEPIKTILTN
jgi:UDP-N-acetylmuramate--alanine ligase